MAQQQPSLEAKKAYFAQWRPLPHSDDETDAVDDNAEGQVDDDELDPREQRMRHRHRRFFRNSSPREAVAAEADPNAHDYYSKEEMGGEVQETPGDEVVVVVTSSAQATPAVKKKPAKASSKRSRNVVDELLENDGDDDVEFIGETPIDATKRRRAFAKSAAPSQPTYRPPPKLQSWSSSSTTKKRNKEGQVNMRPEGEQIFRGLVFYYVPNNEIAPARRLRMQKAREYGAARTSDEAQATHIIVDRDIGYRDAEKAMARKRKGVVIVNEDYPIECVQFRALLDGKQKRYMLAGQPEEEEEEEEEEEGGGEQRTMVGAKEEKAGEKEVLSAREKLRLISEPSRNPKKWNSAPKATPPNTSEESPGIDSQPIVLDVHTARDEAQACEATQTESAKQRGTAPGDELTEVIDMMQEFKDLPLDNDDEEETVSPAAHDSGSEDDRPYQRRASAPKKAAPASAGPSLERFACAHAGSLDAHASSANARTVQVLQAMLSYYERTSDTWRVMAYRRAIATLRRQPAKISSARDALRLPGVGQRLAAKIEEIATTDRLQRLEHAEKDDDDDDDDGGGGGANAALRLFLGVHGVGPALAAQWAAWGMRTLEDVVGKDGSGIKLTPGQRLGIERYEDLHTKIPRDEVEALAAVVRAEAASIDAAVETTIGGSYRRGAPLSGDVDIMLSRPDTTCVADLAPFLRELVTRLQRSGFLVATLAGGGNDKSSSSSSSSSSSIWQGCCVLPGGSGRFRRMDLLVVPETQMGGALIYFTGNDVFNRSLRLLARKRGMRLNQRGLYKRIEAAGEKGRMGMVVEEDLVEGRCERKIFEILGVEWREPTERWC